MTMCFSSFIKYKVKSLKKGLILNQKIKIKIKFSIKRPKLASCLVNQIKIYPNQMLALPIRILIYFSLLVKLNTLLELIFLSLMCVCLFLKIYIYIYIYCIFGPYTLTCVSRLFVYFKMFHLLIHFKNIIEFPRPKKKKKKNIKEDF